MGMGFLGWTEQQTLDTSIPAIELAYEGRLEMLQMLMGVGGAAPLSAGPITPPTLGEISSVLRQAATKPK